MTLELVGNEPIQGTVQAFATRLSDGSVVSWGNKEGAYKHRTMNMCDILCFCSWWGQFLGAIKAQEREGPLRCPRRSICGHCRGRLRGVLGPQRFAHHLFVRCVFLDWGGDCSRVAAFVAAARLSLPSRATALWSAGATKVNTKQAQRLLLNS